MTPNHVRRGDGPPILLIHCALAHLGAWAGVMAGLRDHQVLAYDLPGHGGSPAWDRALDYQAQSVDWAASLLSGPSHVVGHSFGGTVALRLAVERPDMVERLTLIEPVYFAAVRDHDADAFSAHEASFEPVVAAYEAGDLREMARAFTALWGTGKPPSEAELDQLSGQMPMIIAQGDGITGDSGRVFAPGVLEQLDCPVHLVRGSDTQPIVPAIHSAIMARLPQAFETVVQGAGHMAPITHARDVVAAIRRS
ncbi:alpha/beta fold hydrolase [Shimia ponticola]|uniref:alpha/beta fold hydrolase n=1 Tax=Shimia ponticola TaxID=2582893 RepID=UPI0011BF4DED|nr:alpha/beta hydrolase [Shimia ponticola]